MNQPDNIPPQTDDAQAAQAEGEALLAQYAALENDAEDEHQHGCSCCQSR